MEIFFEPACAAGLAPFGMGCNCPGTVVTVVGAVAVVGTVVVGTVAGVLVEGVVELGVVALVAGVELVLGAVTAGVVVEAVGEIVVGCPIFADAGVVTVGVVLAPDGLTGTARAAALSTSIDANAVIAREEVVWSARRISR